jgi:hypothetical protein
MISGQQKKDGAVGVSPGRRSIAPDDDLNSGKGATPVPGKKETFLSIFICPSVFVNGRG